MTAPMHGITVVDFSPLLPGPFASRMLADMGANVVRIESPTRGDMVRTMPPFVEGVSAIHAYLNRNKRHVALDLKSEEGLRAARELVSVADVLIEQFRPGVMARLGLSFETLSQLNPRLVYCSITGYGQDGPLRDRAGHDLNYLALAGVAGCSGRRASGPPPLGFQAADVGGGSLHAVIGILAALRQRDLDGVGQQVDISMTDCAFHLNPIATVSCLTGAKHDGPESGLLDGGSHYDYYRTADDRWLAVGSLEPAFLQALCEAVGEPDLLPRFGSSPQEAKSDLAELLQQRSLAEWTTIFERVDACVEPVLSLQEAMSSELAQARGWQVQVPLGESTIAQPALPIKFSRFTPDYGKAGGEVGVDNGEVLRK